MFTNQNRSGLKNTGDVSSYRYTRARNQKKVRLARRNNIIAKKRMESDEQSQSFKSQDSFEGHIKKCSELKSQLFSKDLSQVISVIDIYRNLACLEEPNLMPVFYNQGIIDKMLHLINYTLPEHKTNPLYPGLMTKVLRCLVSITYHSCYIDGNIGMKVCEYIVRKNMIQMIQQIFKQCNNPEMMIYCTSIISNIASDSNELRKLCVNLNMHFMFAHRIQIIVSQNVIKPIYVKFLQRLTLCISTMTPLEKGGGLKTKPFEKIIPIMADCIRGNMDTITLRNTLKFFACLSNCTNKELDLMIENEMCNRVVKSLSHPDPGVQEWAMNICDHLVSGTDVQTEVVVEHPGCIERVVQLLNHSNENLASCAFHFLSNIFSGCETHTLTVLSKSDVINDLLISTRSQRPKLKIEAIYCVSSIISCNEMSIIIQLLKSGLMKCLTMILKDFTNYDDDYKDVVCHLLKNMTKMFTLSSRMKNNNNPFIRNFLEYYKNEDPIKFQFTSMQGLELLEALQNIDGYSDHHELITSLLDVIDGADDVEYSFERYNMNQYVPAHPQQPQLMQHQQQMIQQPMVPMQHQQQMIQQPMVPMQHQQQQSSYTIHNQNQFHQ
jgi:hypothetical protein